MKRSPGLFGFLIPLFFTIAIFAFFRMFWLYWTRGRDPERDSASVQYGPPDNLTPGECAALLDSLRPRQVVRQCPWFNRLWFQEFCPRKKLPVGSLQVPWSDPQN